MTARDLGKIFKRTFKGWNEDDPFRQSAAIAYYAIFSLPALLILVINIAGFFFGKDKVSGELQRQIEGAMGGETASQVEAILQRAGETKAGVISTVIAIFTIAFGATGVFMQLQKSLDRIWDVKAKQAGFMMELKHRLFSFGVIVAIGFLLLVSLAISTALSAFSHWLQDRFPEAIAYLFFVLDFAVSLSVISALFAIMFKMLPDVKQKWRYIWPGAFLTGALFTIGKYGLSLYFGKADPGSVYGAAGSIVLILLWVSYSSMIVFFGAEFTKQYELFKNYKPEPTLMADVLLAQDVTVSKDGKVKSNGSVIADKKILSSNGQSNGHNEHELKIKNNGRMDDKNETVTKTKNESLLKKELSVVNKDIRVPGAEEKKKRAELLARYRKRRIKNRKELQREIEDLEKQVNVEVDEISDNLKLPLLDNALFKMLGIETAPDSRSAIDEYLTSLALARIRKKPENWADKVAKIAELLRD